MNARPHRLCAEADPVDSLEVGQCPVHPTPEPAPRACSCIPNWTGEDCDNDDSGEDQIVRPALGSLGPRSSQMHSSQTQTRHGFGAASVGRIESIPAGPRRPAFWAWRGPCEKPQSETEFALRRHNQCPIKLVVDQERKAPLKTDLGELEHTHSQRPRSRGRLRSVLQSLSQRRTWRKKLLGCIAALLVLANLAWLDYWVFFRLQNSSGTIAVSINGTEEWIPVQDYVSQRICLDLAAVMAPADFYKLCPACMSLEKSGDFSAVVQLCALSDLYFQQRQAGQSANSLGAGWMQSPDVCSWQGVQCGPGNNVSELMLTGVVGSLPDSLGSLIFLQNLQSRFVLSSTAASTLGAADANNASLQTASWAFPSSIWRLPGLKQVLIQRGHWKIDLDDIGSARSLELLHLLFLPQATGAIPANIGNTPIRSLVLQNVSINASFPSWIPSSQQWRQSLVELVVESCGLTGDFPNDLAAFNSLAAINFQNNDLTGTVSSAMCSKFSAGSTSSQTSCQVGGNPLLKTPSSCGCQ
ncbi:uncharacterized protein BJ171DRAFT_602154 [Polychytrium aggregatum]|uniref:uncharacterized protein n=1 Tax=Polychytrium aggregatum TaxID=110093 RepID=UPI0022FF3A0A|nr:uncharacterized protein BJ171DRAFT_602154 [Polychytrium aggregatum]KAI9197341.1 hypothetical protein BJ171DRAFT_602154 [Polychytrium aggregatum]